MSETVTVPRVVKYDDNTPLDVDGRVVGVLNANPTRRRATVLVEEPAEEYRDGDTSPEGVDSGLSEDFLREGETLEDKTYRQLQEECKRQDIPANQTKDDLREALQEIQE